MSVDELPELDPRTRLALDIDLRLADHWNTWLDPRTVFAHAVEDDDTLRDTVGALVRTAYAQGYIDALREDKDGRRSELHRTHGYRPE